MDKTDANTVLDQALTTFARRSYAELVAMIDRPETVETKGPSGAHYQIEFNVFYDDSHKKEDLRIVGSIDDGGLRSLMPLTRTEIMKPTGELV